MHKYQTVKYPQQTKAGKENGIWFFEHYAKLSSDNWFECLYFV